MRLAEQLHAPLLRFEREWRGGHTPNIADVIATAGLEEFTEIERQAFFVELVAIDLEFRWKLANSDSKSTVTTKRLEDYFAEIPTSSFETASLLELIGEEYRARHRWGDRPSRAEYECRFRKLESDLTSIFDSIDRELLIEAEVDSDRTADDSLVVVATDSADKTDANLRYSDYLLQRLLGSGGVGKVYLALHKPTRESFAVKFLKKAFLKDPHTVSRFVREAEVVGSLRHPGIVAAHGLGRTPHGGYFIVMDLVRGPNLDHFIATNRPSPVDVVRWMSAAADAVEYAHREGIVHCDLKPSNLLLSEDGGIRVTDFGFARTLRQQESILTGIAGTAAYMAPEQIDSCWGHIGPHTDVYGLGAVMFHLLTGRPPFEAQRVVDLLAQVVKGIPHDLRSLFPGDVDRRLCEICLQCLQKNSDQRFASAIELALALRRFRC